MADHSRNQARRRTGLVALAFVGALIGTTASSAPAAAHDNVAEAIIGAALFYGLTQAQAPHFYDRGYYFDPHYYYFDDWRGHWRARKHHRRHAREHRRRDHARKHWKKKRRQYSYNRYRDDGPGYRSGRGYRDDHGNRGRDRRDRSRSRRDRDRDQDRRGRNRRGH